VVHGTVPLKDCVAVEALVAEGFLQWVSDCAERDSFAPKQVPGNVWDLLVEVTVHASDVVDPHDLKGGSQEA